MGQIMIKPKQRYRVNITLSAIARRKLNALAILQKRSRSHTLEALVEEAYVNQFANK